MYLSKALFLVFCTIYSCVLCGQKNLELIEYYEASKIISLHEYTITDTPVIAIIDKGVKINHEDLSQVIWYNKYEIPGNRIDDDLNGFIDDVNGWNFSNNTNDVSIGGVGNWHGTPVNGIIGADNNNNLGVKGICSVVKLMNIVKGDSINSIINSLRYIYQMRKVYNESNGEKGAFIVAVNCSWGKDSLFASDYPEWCSMYDKLGEEGVLSVHSVPNENIDVDLYGDMPSTCTSDYLITVTNSTQSDQKVYDAGYGAYSVDVAAPGDNSYTALNTGRYGYFGGTSASAPYVTGAIGMMYVLPSDEFQDMVKTYPAESALLIKSMLLNGVDVLPAFEDVTTSGGRLNLFKTMKLLCDYFGEAHLYENLFESIEILSISPNPAIVTTNLQIESCEEQEITITILNIHGQSMSDMQAVIEVGITEVPVSIPDLNNGVYIIQVKSNNISKSVSLLVR